MRLKNRTLVTACFSVSALAGALGAPSAMAAGEAFGLGQLNGGPLSVAYGVSADGSVVVGSAGDGFAGPGQKLKAFRWTQDGGLLSLGMLPGGNSSIAYGVSADGSVVVGVSGNDGGAQPWNRAFRWTRAGGMENLGVLNGGSVSLATGVSADGNVVVGFSDDPTAGYAIRAFRWTPADGMVSLGLLNGGSSSGAMGVSADGSVIVGAAADGLAGNQERAFRWTQADGMLSLGVLNGGSYSGATGVSADGSVIVGQAVDGHAGDQLRAFRWTQADGIMVSLGTLNGGNSSTANGVSADGRVVVGQAYDGAAAGDQRRGFRWTPADGMQSVDQWLRANGVAVAPGFTTLGANATNADGSVVVGILQDRQAYLARVTPAGSGLIDIEAYNRTLWGAAHIPVQLVAQGELVLHGLHGSPLRGLPGAGRAGLWVGGDWGRQEGLAGSGAVGTGEIGVAYGLSEGLRFKLAVGRTHGDQALAHDGRASVRTRFVVPELIAAWPATPLRLSASGYYAAGEADVRRGYENAGLPVKSRGSPDARTAGLRLRLDWQDAIRSGNLAATPYVSVTRYHSRLDGYGEHGGGFPVHWDSRSERSTFGRLGADAVYALDARWTLLGRLEAVHRFEARSGGASGTVLGLNRFAFGGIDYRRDWLRLGLGAEAKAGPGTFSLMLNASSDTNGPRHWAYASYRMDF